MANGGAFGNPLTTGIALNFEVDMTPYRQMMQDNLQFAQTQAAEKKKKEKEFQDILKNIAYDDSKIHTRMRDDARVEYAATIEDVMELKKKNDFGGIMNRIAKFDSKLNNYVDTTTNFRAYEKAAEDGKSWVDMDYINAYNNPEKFDDRYLIDNFSDVATYDKEAGVFSAQAIPKQDEVAFVNNYMQGMQPQLVRDDQGKIKRSGFLSETGDYAYLKAKSADPKSFYQELGIAWLGGGRNNIEQMRRKMGLKPEDLEGTIDTPSGPVAKSLYYATEFMKGVAEPKMYSEELRRATGEKDESDFVWNANNGRNKNWAWSLAKGGSVNIKDKDADVDKRLNINRVSGGVAENEFTLGTDALIQKVAAGGAQGVFDDAKLPNNTTIKGTPVSILDIKGKKYVQLASSAILTEAEEERILELSRIVKSGNASTAQEQELKELEKLKVKATYLVPYSPSIESQLYNSLGIVGKQVDQMKSYFDGGGASGSITPRQKSALDAFENKYGRQPTASERQQILKKYQ